MGYCFWTRTGYTADIFRLINLLYLSKMDESQFNNVALFYPYYLFKILLFYVFLDSGK